MFPFLAVRPRRNTTRDVSVPARIPLYPDGPTTSFGQSIGDLQARGATKAERDRVVEAFRQTPDYTDRLEGLPFDLVKAVFCLAAHGRRDLANIAVGDALAGLFGQSLDQIVDTPAFRSTLLRL